MIVAIARQPTREPAHKQARPSQRYWVRRFVPFTTAQFPLFSLN